VIITNNGNGKPRSQSIIIRRMDERRTLEKLKIKLGLETGYAKVVSEG